MTWDAEAPTHDRRLAERFVVEHQVCRVRDGVLWAAWDEVSGQRVALKLSTAAQPDHEAWQFDRGAKVLAGLGHPGVARYVTHGQTRDGRLYLATAWVDGETLSQRLVNGPLRADEALSLLSAIAPALAALHRHGMVHGRLRPSCILLAGGELDKPMLMGFGLLRSAAQHGLADLRSLEYLSPEQASGELYVGPSSDVFSLGSLSVECLTGAAPFHGQHPAVVLTRIVYEELPSLERLCAAVSPWLAQLIAHMLAKEPRNRIADGSALVDAVADVARAIAHGQRLSVPRPVRTDLAAREQGLVSMVVARSAPELTEAAAATATRGTLANLLDPLGARVALLTDGTIVTTVVDRRLTARDQAQVAARCALMLKESSAVSAVVLVTGRGVVSGHQPIGEVVTRAVELLGQCADNDPLLVRLDELTASLLDQLFDVRTEGAEQHRQFVLHGEKSGLDPTRLLLGRPTPCVGREHELRLIDTLVASTIDERHAQVLLLLGASGLGKSRLRHEFVHALALRSQPVTVLLGEAEVMHEGAVYGPLRRALSRLCGLDEHEGAQAVRRLRARLCQNLPDAQAEQQRVVEFLGELCGVRFADDESPRLRTARQDPRVMNEQIALAFVDFVRAECHAQPVVLILEDLHWGDAATIRLIDTTLRALAEEPLFVLALARPEVNELFPGLWAECRLHELRLGGLSTKASRQLVREVLGSTTPDTAVAHIAHLAGGNALYLEELIRAAAASQDPTEIVPETVLAMLQTRFQRLAAGARRVLWAASVFGERFERGGLQALLGADLVESRTLDHWLDMLEERETIVRQCTGSRTAQRDVQYLFRHGLLRDAAYAMLDEDERRTCHALAGAYLEQTGQGEPGVLGEHYRRGGALAQAAACYAQAAAHALGVSDLTGALRAVERGLACDATGEVKGRLLAVESWAGSWSWQHGRSYAAGCDGLPLLVPGSAPWYQALGGTLGAAAMLGKHEQIGRLLTLFAQTVPLPGEEYAFVEPAMAMVVMLSVGGRQAAAAEVLALQRAVCSRLDQKEVRLHGLEQLAITWYEMMLGGNAVAAHAAALAGREALRIAGGARYLASSSSMVGLTAALLGNRALAASASRHAVAEVAALNEPMMLSAIQAQCAYALISVGLVEHYAEARELAVAIVAQSRTPNFWEGLAHLTLAALAATEDRLDDAAREAQQAVEVCVAAPALMSAAHAMLAQVLLARGQVAEASAAAAAGQARAHALGETCLGQIKLQLMAARCADAAGEHAAARVELAQAAHQMVKRSLPLTGAARTDFFTYVPEHREVLDLCQTWGITLDSADFPENR